VYVLELLNSLPSGIYTSHCAIIPSQMFSQVSREVSILEFQKSRA